MSTMIVQGMEMRRHKLRNLRSKLYKQLKNKSVELRVTGSAKTGFFLCGEINKILVPLNETFSKQGEAINKGMEICGQTAKKILLPKVEKLSD